MITRLLEREIKAKSNCGKAIILLGARQVGKTTLLKKIFPANPRTLWLNADEYDIQSMFDRPSSSSFRALFGKHETVIIDEAQKIPEIGRKLKIITDEIPQLQVIATGSSAFELTNKLNEPLTGRKWEYYLYPISYSEMVAHHGIIEENRLLEHRLLYGYYPEVVSSLGDEKDILRQLSDSYLYKDILMIQDIKRTDALVKLLQALSFQVGNMVSYTELSTMTGLDSKTVEKYITLLEQVFIIFRLGSYSRNLRKELKRSRKIYFYDNGIRNALISNFSSLNMRADQEALWENFLMSERRKYLHYNKIWCNSYFWRTTEQQELDYIEDMDGILYAYEFKWNPAKKAKLSKTFSGAYPNNEYKVINRENFQEFLLS